MSTCHVAEPAVRKMSDEFLALIDVHNRHVTIDGHSILSPRATGYLHHGQEHGVLPRAVPESNDSLVHALFMVHAYAPACMYVSKTATSAQHYAYLACMRSIGWMVNAMILLLRLGLCGAAMVDSDKFLSELFSAEFRHCCSAEPLANVEFQGGQESWYGHD